LLPITPPGPGEVVRVNVGGAPVSIWNVAGQLYAIADTCPHRGEALSAGALELRPDGPAVVCSAHAWRFDLKTGACVFGPERVRVYDIRAVDGGIVVEAATVAQTGDSPTRLVCPPARAVPGSVDDSALLRARRNG
jgi:nitrite reductase/ring-hydroxylating ferredoxin subunit